MPLRLASAAETTASVLATSGSKLDAWPNGIGKLVVYPWMTSRPKMSGMPRRVSYTASRCSLLSLAAPTTEKTPPQGYAPSRDGWASSGVLRS